MSEYPKATLQKILNLSGIIDSNLVILRDDIRKQTSSLRYGSVCENEI